MHVIRAMDNKNPAKDSEAITLVGIFDMNKFSCSVLSILAKPLWGIIWSYSSDSVGDPKIFINQQNLLEMESLSFISSSWKDLKFLSKKDGDMALTAVDPFRKIETSPRSSWSKSISMKTKKKNASKASKKKKTGKKVQKAELEEKIEPLIESMLFDDESSRKSNITTETKDGKVVLEHHSKDPLDCKFVKLTERRPYKEGQGIFNGPFAEEFKEFILTEFKSVKLGIYHAPDLESFGIEQTSTQSAWFKNIFWIFGTQSNDIKGSQKLKSWFGIVKDGDCKRIAMSLSKGGSKTCQQLQGFIFKHVVNAMIGTSTPLNLDDLKIVLPHDCKMDYNENRKSDNCSNQRLHCSLKHFITNQIQRAENIFILSESELCLVSNFWLKTRMRTETRDINEPVTKLATPPKSLTVKQFTLVPDLDGKSKPDLFNAYNSLDRKERENTFNDAEAGLTYKHMYDYESVHCLIYIRSGYEPKIIPISTAKLDNGYSSPGAQGLFLVRVAKTQCGTNVIIGYEVSSRRYVVRDLVIDSAMTVDQFIRTIDFLDENRAQR